MKSVIRIQRELKSVRTKERQQTLKRDTQIRNLVAAGLSMAHVAHVYQLSRERVRVICNSTRKAKEK